MNLKVGEKVLPLKHCYELIINYANRDDELTSISRLYHNEENVIEIMEVLNQGVIENKFPRVIPNFSKYFIFQNVNKNWVWDENDLMEDWVENYEQPFEDRILWDYETCSGEIPLEVYSWELYYYAVNGDKYKMEVVK